MAAVIRVKRRIDEEPLNAFVLNCKKRKVNQENASIAVASSSNNDDSLTSIRDEKSTILKFAGTVETQDENVTSHITKITKEEAKELMGKTRVPQPVARARESRRLKSQEDRFRIVNCSRAVDPLSNGEEKAITILDIEKQTTLPNAADEAAISSSMNSRDAAEAIITTSCYVYDLYVSDLVDLGTDIDDGMLENQMSVHPFDHLTYGSRHDNGLSASSGEDSEDSNAENNWRNDYPDTDPEDDDSSIGERDMRRAVDNFTFDDDTWSTDEDYCDEFDSCARGRDYERYHRMLKLMSQNSKDEVDSS